jgi:uncharacterized protein YkwD
MRPIVDGLTSESSRLGRLLCLVAALVVLGGPSAAAATCSPATTGAEQLECFAREARQELDVRLNRDRAAHGRSRLRHAPSLDGAAAAYASAMVARHFFSHVSPDGADLLDRMRASGYLNGWRDWHVGEVLAWGSGGLESPDEVLRAWLDSPPHRRQIRGSDYRDFGVGAARGTPWTADGATYAVLLGVRERRYF